MLATLPKSRLLTLLGTIGLLALVVHVLYSRESFQQLMPFSAPSTALPPVVTAKNALPCRNLPPTDDVVVILRTGATEIEDKLPAHFNTTFKCYNDLIIFSDYEETLQGHQVHDVLASVSQAWKEQVPDFEIYLRLQREGRAGLRPDELSGLASFEGSKSGKKENPGWRLDKWKFLPMMRETLRLRPDKKWYVFIESDSYLVWSNLLQWLETLDPSKPLYIGSENQIGRDIYAHGGSVFVLSRPAVLKAVEIYEENEDIWHERTNVHWAGDCILGIALKEAGIPLTWAWPMLQGGQPEKMDFSENKLPGKKLWCTPALSYHHFAPQEIERMWNFEQQWIKSRFDLAESEDRLSWQQDKKDILYHRDVFRRFILPNITTEWWEWNNLSPDLIVTNADWDACYHLCEDSENCRQFSVGPPGCSISTKAVMLGQRWADYRSYWVNDRVKAWMRSMDEGCKGKEGWLRT